MGGFFIFWIFISSRGNEFISIVIRTRRWGDYGYLVACFVAIWLQKIPEFAKGLGKGIRQFKDATDGIQRDIQNNVSDIKSDLDVKKQIDDIDSGKE